VVTNALSMAIQARTPPAGAIVHSDQGVQFASWTFTQRAKDSGLVPSMGSVGDWPDSTAACQMAPRPAALAASLRSHLTRSG
jgi:transposase InsO family protein